MGAVVVMFKGNVCEEQSTATPLGGTWPEFVRGVPMKNFCFNLALEILSSNDTRF